MKTTLIDAPQPGSSRPNSLPSNANGWVRRAFRWRGSTSAGRLPPCIGCAHAGATRFDPVDNPQDRPGRGKDPRLAEERTHLATEVLPHHRRLLARLDEEIRREEAPR